MNRRQGERWPPVMSKSYSLASPPPHPKPNSEGFWISDSFSVEEFTTKMAGPFIYSLYCVYVYDVCMECVYVMCV